jgi:hypothetical protein
LPEPELLAISYADALNPGGSTVEARVSCVEDVEARETAHDVEDEEDEVILADC